MDNKLTAIGVKNTTKPGRYSDGGGLYLYVPPDKARGGKRWVFRWRDRNTGKTRDKGLGPVRDVPLVKARRDALECRQQLREGIDPIHASKVEGVRRTTFGQCAQMYMDAHRDGWRNEKHAAQWSSTLDTYAAILQPLPVGAIDTDLIIKVLSPIWTTKTETATRVRQRIEAVLNWATARKFRSGENPARWRGHLENLLPKPTKLKKVEHRAALPYSEAGTFMTELRQQVGLGALALELQILTACRPGEVANARWAEFDLDGATWTIPGERMKAGKEHRVPLSPPAVELLRKLPRVNAYVFPSSKKNQPITTAAMLKALRTIRPGFDAHGFRSTFRDWAADQTAYPRDVAEAALAHAVQGVEAVYRRTDLLNKRARLMADWAKYCAKPAPAGNVRGIREGAKA
ncbi:MAG: site-specific integrase [Rhodanobacter sp.]|nr:MAG: site-specific integrase [Rhodanobacter sp.]TAM14659.1 MAG: site-specific integrase [Rhodanobacter sp.]TAM37451.1 MAG: site-specific integrase [Rhodanobacter sp.]